MPRNHLQKRAITESEITSLSELFQHCVHPWGYARSERDQAMSYLASHPYIFFPFGYDEARIFVASDKVAQNQISNFYRKLGRYGDDAEPFKGSISYETLIRQTSTGSWHLPYYIWGQDPFSDRELELGIVGQNDYVKQILVKDFLETIESDVSISPERVIFPTLWIPPTTARTNIVISSLASKLLLDIYKGHKSLEDLRWQDLEDIVAELLRQHGLDVHVTPRTRDGGRDIVASGELFPGLKSILAVEVTKQNKVGIAKVSKVLYQNRHFPMLMVATSGHFTAGVTQERGLPENRMRLHLLDGDQLNEWIRTTMSPERRSLA